eukprot:6192094-Pleurochrysis_carterae.AAC.1
MISPRDCPSCHMGDELPTTPSGRTSAGPKSIRCSGEQSKQPHALRNAHTCARARVPSPAPSHARLHALTHARVDRLVIP